MGAKEKKQMNVWEFLGIVAVMIFLIVVFFIGNNMGSEQENYETVSITGIGSSLTISEPFVQLSITGNSNSINVSKNTKISSIRFTGLSNTVYLCENLHTPEVSDSGLSNQIIYQSC